MAKVRVGAIELEYERMGPAEGPQVLLIMGLGAQMTLWPRSYCDAFVRRGFHVVRFDNRDIGLSTKLEQAGRPALLPLLIAAALGRRAPAPYHLDDMARDTAGLIEALDLDRPHVVGASMGGMIGQLLAIHYGHLIGSLTSIMSTTGNPRLPWPKPRVLLRLLRKPASGDREALIDHSVESFQVFGSPGYPSPREEIRALVEENVDRMYYPEGFFRHLAAILASGDRSKALAQVKVPTLVIHGDADPLVPPQGGIDTARQIPGARLEIIRGMGHDLPTALADRIVGLIAEHIEATSDAARAARVA